MTQPVGKRDTLHQSFVLGALLLALAGFLGMIADFLVALLLAAVIAGLLYPFQRWLTRLFRGRSGAAAVCLLLLALLAIVLPLAGLTGIVAAEAVHITGQIRPWVQQFATRDLPSVEQLPGWAQNGALLLEPYKDSLLEKGAEIASSLGSWLVANVSTVTQGTIGFLLSLFIMTYALYYFLVDGERLIAALKSHLPLSAADRDLVVDRGLAVTRASLKGIIVVGALQGLLVGLSFAVLGISGAVFWGAVVFVLSAIPGLGAPIVWVPAAIYLGVTGQFGAAIGLALWGGLVVGLVDNILRPLIVGRDAKLPDVVVLVAILGGIITFGMIGLILGPIIAAVLDTLLGIYRRAFANQLPR
ncbi:MAG: AI-2E family transporter [Pseudomonadales bacterium]